jgi:phosphopantothenoylcysteine decarboxylase / phosphopantothenate---cysteine ligase
MKLNDKKILLALTGGIACYKMAIVASKLLEQGALVQVLLSEGAKQFIQPLTFQAITGNPVRENLFDLQAEAGMGHIELARWPDLILIAPATANHLAKLALGIADDLITTLSLVTRAPILIAPAMNQAMWHHPATQKHVNELKNQGIHFIGPATGRQACGDFGEGRMEEPSIILKTISDFIQPPQCLANENILITAGPTQEFIDPVRYITNKSSGKMGYALADAAQKQGAKVTLISGPVTLPPPAGVDVISVITAEEMLQAVMQNIGKTSIFIGSAAVSDYRCESPQDKKIVKNDAQLQLNLIKNPDILSTVAALKSRPFVVGFAAQTHDVITLAKQKLINKNLDLIIANQVGTSNTGFDHDTNACTMISAQDEKIIPLAKKTQIALEILSEIKRLK